MSVAYSYLRISTSEQLHGDGIRRQLERTRAYAATRGLTLDESLRDIGVSAYKGRNRQSGALAGFHRLVEQGKIPRGSCLLVESLDRLSREKPVQALGQFLALINSGIEIVTLVDNRIYNAETLDDSSGLSLFGSLTVMCRAHDESKTKSDRVGAAWKRKHERAKEKKVTARCPGWLRLSPTGDKFEIIPEKAQAVRRAFELTAKGIGRQKVAAILNSKRMPALGGKRWYAASLARLLNGDAVLGTYQPHEVRTGKRLPRGEPLLNYYPTIIKPDLVARARAAMNESRDEDEIPSRAPAGRKGGTYTNLFGGLIFCNECNSPMRLRNRGRTRGDKALVCSNRIETVGQAEQDRCQHGRQYQYEAFERDFLRFIEEIDVSIFDEGRSQALDLLADEVARLELDLNGRQKVLKRLIEAFDGEDIEAVRTRARDLNEQVSELERQLAESKRQFAHQQAIAVTGKEHVLTIGRLQARIKRTEGEERYAIRAQLAQEIRRVIDTIWFGHPKVDCIVYIHQSKNSRFHPGYFLNQKRIGRSVTWEFTRPTQEQLKDLPDSGRFVTREEELAAGAHASRSRRASARRAKL